MGQSRVEEVDFYVLLDKVKAARSANALIDRSSQKDDWNSYISTHGVREAALEAYAKVKFSAGPGKLVAIQAGDAWDGCYAYSIDDEAAIKFIPGDPPAASAAPAAAEPAPAAEASPPADPEPPAEG